MKEMNCCTCAFKEQMIAKMKEMRKNNPTKENEWVSTLFDDDKAESLCCMMVKGLFDGYCKECNLSVSEAARIALRPLMEAAE